MQTLNAIEQKVLEMAMLAMRNNGGDFGFVDDLYPLLPNLTVHQIDGYLSQLVQKGFLTVSDDGLSQCFYMAR